MSHLVSIKHLLAVLAFSVLISACSSSRKSVSRIDGPPPALSKPTPAKKPEDKKEAAKAPFNVPAFGKEVKKATYNIAFFAPLYLDSVFATSNDIPGRTMPKYVLPGLEFYEGAQLALDTLQQQGYNLKVTVYDSKGKQSIASLIRNKSLEETDLILGAVNNPELKELSDFAKNKEINFVSATFPNDGGINDNPFLYITNSTLKTHCEALQNYAQNAFTTKNIVLFRRNTAFESRLAADFKASYDKMDNNKKVKIREVIWNEATTPEDISKYLLTDRTNVIIVTALDEAGAKSLLRKLSVSATTYPLQIFGMPTWDVFKLKDPEFKGLQVYYSSPYFNDKTDAYSRYVNDYFRKTYKARPSDMAFKGFDLTYYFVKLLHNNGVYFNGMVSESPKVITNYNFQPVYLKEGDNTPSYFENKNIFIIQKGDSTDIKMNR
ncbi:ABC-type branched-subunit amino acid transport system substrate-binding protein [Chitinophaga niastensis]|uniref:ABC-type branched-subunit amino acid transport system substrate-binding protein n=1 Tax=Chitinophaga niastensis TaxID=536980 RepID=A0A2P8HVL1_CHINA|nr:ABC transporter substrate-binding protein [Chitinophaga niastensis]PSL50225.1 ABC-type branched-subunit amino acid transport system substrate-binding protein [Chitinophaga niastensis]